MIFPSHFLQSVPEILHDSVARWWERAGREGVLPGIYAALPGALQAELPRLVAASEFAASALIQDPQGLGWVSRHLEPSIAGAANREYHRRVSAAATSADAQRLLREWRRREMLRIAWRDIAGRAGVVDTLHAVSELADACIGAATAAAQAILENPFGRARNAAGADVPLIVLGMGKLGGMELNFSSDVDLVFLFAQAGQTDGARVIENEEYFTRVGRELIRLLDARTENGFAFRVDMRLRPFGESGPLVVSLASLEGYLQQHGRDWERYAWIKARAVVGAASYREAYEEFVRPSVYRRYLDFGVFESLRGMKALIEREVSRRDLDQHLKLGKGGIREIEFIVQSMQLVRGGSDRRLQKAALLEVLPLLQDSKLLAAAAIAELKDAYLVLRKAENALQMMRDEQAHTLPDDEPDRARLSVNMGLADWAAASASIAAARAAVATQFAALLFGAADSAYRHDEVGVAWLDSDDVRISEELANCGFP